MLEFMNFQQFWQAKMVENITEFVFKTKNRIFPCLLLNHKETLNTDRRINVLELDQRSASHQNQTEATSESNQWHLD